MSTPLEKLMIVEVSCRVDFEDLDGDGINNPSFDPTEVTLDLFHSKVAISCLDDFDIITREAGKNDQDGDFVLILDGHIPADNPRPIF